MIIEQAATDIRPAVRTRTFRGHPQEVAAARAFACEVLAGHRSLDEAVLAVSELATNAVRHSRSGHGGTFTVDIAIFADPDAVRVYVADDGGPTTPHVIPDADRCDEGGGHGLALVESLTSMWGYLSSGDGGTTWCELTPAV
jgi:anti-sigma regulatory factor (Ser/Thr protein kinase)